MSKNPKLAPEFEGPGKIIDINDTNAKVKIGNKIKVLSIKKLKLYLQLKMSETDTKLQDSNFHDFYQLTTYYSCSCQANQLQKCCTSGIIIA
jgi:hypothetical protein